MDHSIPSAFWGQSPGGKATRRPAVGMDTFLSALGHWHSSRDNPAVLTCCGGHTSRSGGPGSPGTAHSSHTAHSSPLAHVSPVGNRLRMKGVRLPCPHLDMAETDPAQTRPGLLVGRQEREQAEPLTIAHSSPGPGSAFAGKFHYRETLPQTSSFHCCTFAVFESGLGQLGSTSAPSASQAPHGCCSPALKGLPVLY